MTDLETLYRKLELASFSQRQQIASEVVRDSGGDIAPFLKGLGHPHRAVRLGIIDIVQRAGYRDALRALLEHATDHDGDDRVFAVRALADLARTGDDFLVEPAKRWMASGDPYLEPHGARLVALLRPSTTTPDTPAAPPTGASLDKLVVQLFTAVKGADRIAALEKIEQRGPQALVAAAKLTLQKGNEALVAYICRALIRQAPRLSSPDTLAPLLESARRRLGDAPIAHAAIDDALVAVLGSRLTPALLARVVEMDRVQLESLVMRLIDADASEVALHVPTLLDALAQRPSLWSTLGPALVYAAPSVRESARVELHRQCGLVVDELRRSKELPPVTVVSVAWVLAKTAEPGEPLPFHLRLALDRIAVAEASVALVALCERLATQEAAAVLLAMLRDPLLEARAAARDKLATWRSPWVRIENENIVPHYEDAKGQALALRDGKLVSASGEEYVLDHRGRPIAASETEWSGCLCCSPPRALTKRRGEGLRCPSSWESHLRDAGRTTFERDHALGRCKRCDSTRPRARDGARVFCIDCGAGLAADEVAIGPAPVAPSIPSEHGRRDHEDAFPKPPTRDELDNVSPTIRAAILSNVFLQARDGEQRWNGSGVVIARDGNHLAILTNRHVVESDDRSRLCALQAMTVSGEVVRTSCVWRAKKGVDLALIEITVRHPENVGITPLGTGDGKVGAAVFALGNPLGLAWSYNAGTISAIRHWTTQEGQSVRILQTDTNIAPGSSGGGLFHSDGHLLGVVSFLAQGYAGGSAHFALSVGAIREALVREDVRWRGVRIGDP